MILEIGACFNTSIHTLRFVLHDELYIPFDADFCDCRTDIREWFLRAYDLTDLIDFANTPPPSGC